MFTVEILEHSRTLTNMSCDCDRCDWFECDSFVAFNDDFDGVVDDAVDTVEAHAKEAHPRKAAYLPRERTRAGYKALRKRGDIHFKVHGQKWNDKTGNSRKNPKRALAF